MNLSPDIYVLRSNVQQSWRPMTVVFRSSSDFLSSCQDQKRFA